jgi:hypothetical protein
VEALAVAVVFGLAVASSGRGIAALIDRADPPQALASCVALACLIVLGVTVAALGGFAPWPIAGAWLALVLGGWWRRSAAGRFAGPLTVRARLLFLVSIGAAVPMLVFPVPLDTDAQGFGLLALAMRDGGTIDTLAPWRPDIAYLYSPGALLLFATASALGGASMPAAMMGVSHAAFVLLVWLAWELGCELAHQSSDPAHGEAATGVDRARWAWATSVSAALSVGTWTALLDSHYTAIVGLLPLLAWVTALLRFLRSGRRGDALAATAAMAAVLMTHADSAVILALGLLAFALAGRLGRPRPPARRWLVAMVVVPLGAALLVAPWLWSVWPLIRSGIRSPFAVEPSHWRQLVIFHGLAWPLLAAAGACIWIRRRRMWAIVMAAWVLTVIESSTLGWTDRTFPALADYLLRFHYPYSIAWHGPIVPYLTLGAGALVWVLTRMDVRALPAPSARSLAAAALLAGVGVAFADAVLPLERHGVALYGAFASANDLRAMRWIRDHAPRGARILNYPGEYERQRDWEAHWAPIVAERDCVYFRMQPFYAERVAQPDVDRPPRGLAGALAEQTTMLAFWRDPADPANRQRLYDAGIDFVLVPESIGDPTSLARAWRAQPPARLAGESSTADRAAYLNLVYDAGGARVFAVSPPVHSPPDSTR